MKKKQLQTLIKEEFQEKIAINVISIAKKIHQKSKTKQIKFILFKKNEMPIVNYMSQKQ